MIDIPLGKALIAVESKGCRDCYLFEIRFCPNNPMPCGASARADGKNVMFRLVDLPEERK